MVTIQAKKIKGKLKRHGQSVWINNGVKKKGLEANVDLLAVKNEYTFLIQIKSNDEKNKPNHGVRGLQEVAGHSDFIIPTYIYPEKKEAINLRTRLPVLKDIWDKYKE